MCLVSCVNHNTVICHITYRRNIVLHFLPTKRVAWSTGIVLHCIYTLLASILCISFLSLVCQYLYLFNCHDLASSPCVGLLQTSFFYGCFLFYHYLVVANVVELGLPYIVTIYDFSNLFRENTKEYHVFLTEKNLKKGFRFEMLNHYMCKTCQALSCLSLERSLKYLYILFTFILR